MSLFNSQLPAMTLPKAKPLTEALKSKSCKYFSVKAPRIKKGLSIWASSFSLPDFLIIGKVESQAGNAKLIV
jgi:hypothetical protein